MVPHSLPPSLKDTDRLHQFLESRSLFVLHEPVGDIGQGAMLDGEEVKAPNPKWTAAIESLDYGKSGSDKSFGMKQRPDGDIEIDEKFWKEDFSIPTSQNCGGMLKPDDLPLQLLI